MAVENMFGKLSFLKRASRSLAKTGFILGLFFDVFFIVFSDGFFKVFLRNFSRNDRHF